MSTCHYHPQSKAKFVCPDCGEDVCDLCRLEGGMERCGNCAINGPPPGGPRLREPEPAAVAADGGYEQGYDAGQYDASGYDAGGYDQGGYDQTGYDQGGYDQGGYDQGGYDQGGGSNGGGPAPHDMSAMLEVRCANHGDRTADMACLNCLQGYCMDCIPDGTMCIECKRDPDGRAAPQQDYQVEHVELGYDPGMDFAGYDNLDNNGYEESPSPRPRKKKPGGAAAAGGKKAPAGKKGAKKKADGPPIPLIAAGVALLLALGGGGYWFMNKGGAEPFAGPTKVAIKAPKAGTLKGQQVITLEVASADKVEVVTINVDGKYWDKFKAPPFKSDWPTSMLKNGKHTIEAVAQYKNGPTVKDSRTVTTNNPR